MPSSRRTFLASAAAGTALAALPSSSDAKFRKRSGRYTERHRVDLHGHSLTPSYRQALTAHGIVEFHRIPVPAWSPELAMQFMDAHDIAYQMLSVSDPGVLFISDDAQASALATRVNDEQQAVVRAHPQRFGALGVLNHRDVVRATAEAIRCLDDLKMEGVGLLSNARGRYLGDPVFTPLLKVLDDRKAWVFVHPSTVGDDDKPSYSMPDFLAEYPFDTTRTIISLMFNGAFTAFPNIRWQFAHLGGTVPMLRSRLTTLAKNAKLFGQVLGLPPGSLTLNEEDANRFLAAYHYDTALTADAPELAAAKYMAGPHKILFGSDWPFAAMTYSDAQRDPAPALSEIFTNSERHRIDRVNARELFPNVAAAVPA
jgi:predicted TIM-barrel fold metal-dependent hydrolase